MKWFLSLLVVAGVAHAGPAQRVARRVRVGTDVLVTRQESIRPIPDLVFRGAKCVASVRVIKGGFIFGGEGSVGLASCRLPRGGWSAPAFINAGGVSFGLQIGGQIAETVLVFMSEYSRQVLAHGTVKLGADLSAAAGPVGQGGGVGVIPNAEVLTYTRSAGLFAGLTIDGAILTHAPQLNAEAYGRLTPAEILSMPAAQGPAIVQPFTRVLTQFAP